MARIAVVIPSVRPDRYERFRSDWMHLFRRHRVAEVVVWDGETPTIEVWDHSEHTTSHKAGPAERQVPAADRDMFCRRTDACRNYGFVWAAAAGADYVLTLDDDVAPPPGADPIAEHLEVLGRRVPLSWMNTAMGGAPGLRGLPYGVRDEAPVHLSHGVWTGVPDFDGRTQLALEKAGGVPERLPYYVGPVPRGVLFPLCGMNVMVTGDALPHLYFAPMGPDVREAADLHRFADIWLGVSLKRAFDRAGWACYTGASTVVHTRASDATKNAEVETVAAELNERWWHEGDGVHPYFARYAEKRTRFAALIRKVSDRREAGRTLRHGPSARPVPRVAADSAAERGVEVLVQRG